MIDRLRGRSRSSPDEPIPWWEFGLRCVWIVLQLMAAYCLANQVSPFFYQRF
jgi:hypothetical protein